MPPLWKRCLELKVPMTVAGGHRAHAAGAQLMENCPI